MSKESDKIHERKRLEANYAMCRAAYKSAGKAAFGTPVNSAERQAYQRAAEIYRAAGVKVARGTS